VDCQPSDGPTLWELVSSENSGDGLARREVREVPIEALSRLRPLFDFLALAPVAGNEESPEKVTACHRIASPLLGRVGAILGTTLDPDLEHFIKLAVV
jgi:hypothetical protein